MGRRRTGTAGAAAREAARLVAYLWAAVAAICGLLLLLRSLWAAVAAICGLLLLRSILLCILLLVGRLLLLVLGIMLLLLLVGSQLRLRLHLLLHGIGHWSLLLLLPHLRLRLSSRHRRSTRRLPPGLLGICQLWRPPRRWLMRLRTGQPGGWCRRALGRRRRRPACCLVIGLAWGSFRGLGGLCGSCVRGRLYMGCCCGLSEAALSQRVRGWPALRRVRPAARAVLKPPALPARPGAIRAESEAGGQGDGQERGPQWKVGRHEGAEEGVQVVRDLRFPSVCGLEEHSLHEGAGTAEGWVL